MFFRKRSSEGDLPTFLTPRLHLRPYRPADAPEVWQVLSAEGIYATTAYIPRNITLAQTRYWVEQVCRAAQEGTALELAVFSRSDGRYLGNVGLIQLHPRHRSAEITYFIRPDAWGKGYATEAAEVLVRYGFEKKQLHRIAGTCMKQNAASQRVMEKLGFRVEGIAREELYKDGVFLDVTHLALLASEWQARGL